MHSSCTLAAKAQLAKLVMKRGIMARSCAPLTPLSSTRTAMRLLGSRVSRVSWTPLREVRCQIV